MAVDDSAVAFSSPLAEFLSPRDSLMDAGDESTEQALRLEVDLTPEALNLAQGGSGSLRVGLIDSYRLSRECLTTVLEKLHAQIVTTSSASVDDCVAATDGNSDLIIYYPHGSDAQEAAIVRNVAAIRQATLNIPIVVLSDVEEAQQPKIIRSMLNSGAHGFIPTRTTGISIALAAIRFVKAGGTFAPLDQLLSNRPEREPAAQDPARQSPLTARQMAVLSHLRQGKANKIIAHELSMSESTVKVHVRNIMRKMGATNRTQAAYKAQQVWSRIEGSRASDM